MYIFSMDNPFFRFVGRCVDIVWINILTLICCIPVFTVGAALSAMYRILMKLVMHEEGSMTREYFAAFRSNFTAATKVYVPSLLLLLALLGNGYLLSRGVSGYTGTLFIASGVSIGIMVGGLLIFLQYYFSLLARYDADWKQTAHNALRLMVAFFPQSLSMLVILASPIALMVLSDYFLWFWFLYGFGFPGYVIALLLCRIYMRVEKTTLMEEDIEWTE